MSVLGGKKTNTMKPRVLKAQTVNCSDEEKAYRKKMFDDVSKVMNQRLSCTCCLKDIKNEVLIKNKVYIHPFFQVLICKDCLKFYGDGYISPDEDGSDKYCRWCGQGGCLYVCCECPVSICKSCIKRNMNRTVRTDIEKDDWKCFSCIPDPLYELRAHAWAVKSWLKSKKQSKKEVKEVTKRDSNSLEDHLMNGLDYELGLIKEVQKVCKSCETKLRGISRRKDVVSRESLTFKVINQVSEDIASQIKEVVEKLNKFEEDISAYFKALAPVVKKLEEEKVTNDAEANRSNANEESLVLSMSEESSVKSKKKRAHSTDEEDEQSKKHKEHLQSKRTASTSKRKSTMSDDDDNSCSSEKKADSLSNGLTNGDCDTINDNQSETDAQSSKDTEDNTSVYEAEAIIDSEIMTKCSEEGDNYEVKQETFPKLTLRIRKVDEVNKVLEEDRVIESSVGPFTNQNEDIIELDDDIETTFETNKSLENAECSLNLEDVNARDELVNSVIKYQGTPTKDSNKKEKDSKKSLSKRRESSKTSSQNCSVTKEVLNENEKNKSNQKEMEKTQSIENEKLDLTNSEKQGIEKEGGMEVCSNVSGDIFSDEVNTAVVSSTSSDHFSEEGESKKPEKKVRKSRSARNSIKKKEASDNSSDSEIEKLLNTKSLNSKKRKPDILKEPVKNEKMEKTKISVKKGKQKTILDYCNEESDDSVIDLRAELMGIVSSERLDKESLWKMIKMDNTIGMERQSSLSPGFSGDKDDDDKPDNSEDDLLLDSDEEKKAGKKNRSSNNHKEENVETNKSDDSDDGVEDSKSSKWKSDKLLTMKLSDDDSDSQGVFQKKNNKKSDKRNKKKAVFLSDSEGEEKPDKSSKNSSKSSDSSNEEEITPKKKRKRIKRATSSSSGDDNAAVEGSGGKGRKNIKKILKKDSLQESTQNALKEEEERKKRITERQTLYNKMLEECEILSSNVDKLVLDFDINTKEEILSVDKDLVAKLKPHQAEGIKFMWDSLFETIKKAKKSKGSGCILAHCMGLGKTLQVVTLLHTLLSNDVGIKCALVLCPLSTVLNWVNEFEKWLSNVGSGQDVDVFHMTKVTAAYRVNQLKEWQKRGGVMVLAYNLFRLLVNPTKRVKPSVRNAYLETLTDPGPDIVICDEGHLLKNEKTALSKAVEKFRTLRRIVLTGTPLQNNLIEYHCMMQFVKPNLLGTKKEFTNRFVNPIENGQFVDSTPQDVKVMKRRAHVLHKMLDGLVQRKAYNVLVPFLPPKFEYVLSLSLTDVQVKLYQYYLDNLARNKSGSGVGTSLFKDRNMLSLICAHPRLLLVHNEIELMKKEFEQSDEEGSLKEFIKDSTTETSSSSESSSDDSDSSSSVKMVSKRRTRNNRGNDSDEEMVEDNEANKDENWWSSIIEEDQMDNIGASSKLHLFFAILQKCEEIGDKLLVFSQSLFVLDLIEYFLDKIDMNGNVEDLSPGLRGFKGSWAKGVDYFRLDGKTSSENRSNWCTRFNREDNLRARLFLISTRAGGLGINLTGANRVILFDASWNPSHDVQSIFRVYRFGQHKPSYIYRFLNKGTMEQKVYDRQVTKLSMSCRVIDEQQIDRHFSYADLNELYTFTPNERDDKTPPLPKDRLLAEVLQEHKELVLCYHTHDSLLENQENEELNEEERKQAWADFENEKNPPANEMNFYAETHLRVYNMVKEKYPTWSESDVRQAVLTMLSKINTMAGMNQTAQFQQQQLAQQQYMLYRSNLVQQQAQGQQAQRLQSVPNRFYNNQQFGNQVYGNQHYPRLPLVNTANNRIGGSGVNNVSNMGNLRQPATNLIPNPLAMLKPNPFNSSNQVMFQNNTMNKNQPGIPQESLPSTSSTEQPEQ